MEKISLANNILFAEVAQVLSEGKDAVINTKGNSMLPFIKGDVDRVRLRKVSQLSDYDIVLALLSDGHYVLHRIVAIDGDRITLMGDGNILGREWCHKSGILGTAVAIIHADDSETNPLSPAALRLARWWRKLLPIRRYILGIYRRIYKIKYSN